MKTHKKLKRKGQDVQKCKIACFICFNMIIDSIFRNKFDLQLFV